MQSPSEQILTCANCGAVLEETPGGGLGCMFCLLQAGIGGGKEAAQKSTCDSFEDRCFGVYEIDRHPDGSLFELGRGAMGVTYRATDTTLHRKVALKIIKADIAERSADARERFMREARAAAALRHENIAIIHQFGMRLETGQYFYAMELIEGETLENRVRRSGPLDARTTIGIAQQVTSALTAAEKRGLIHRDLKPANLMLVGPEGESVNATTNTKLRVKIIDFGLAKAVHSQTDPKSLTQDRFVGTPAFASPEQFEHSALDVRSDIYSLGETLWFALTGKTPFAGHTVEEIQRAQRSNVLPLEQLKAAHVPSGLTSLLKSMLAFQPASRPGSSELALQLRRCSPEARSVRRTRIILAVAALLVLGMSARFIFQLLRIHSPRLDTVPDKTIAVLPFENRSEDKANAYFADGVQDEILTRLCHIAGLKVISRTSTRQYQSKPANLREIAKELGVANILEGSVQKVADQVRVNVQLVNARTDSNLWADSYDRKLTDIFAVQSQIAREIADALRVNLTIREKETLAKRPTNILEAYDAYLRGLALEARYYSSYSADIVRKVGDFYEQAVRLDPDFAVAWARLSRSDALLYFNRDDQNPQFRRDTAKRALENAQRLEPDSPETLLALGYYQYWVLRDYSLAKTTFLRVIKVWPSSSEVLHALARVTRREGHWKESMEYSQQALILDPRNTELITHLAWTEAMLRQFIPALELCDRALDIAPYDPDMDALKARIYQAQGNLQQAARFLSGVTELSPNDDTFMVKMTQLRLERNYHECTRLLETRLAQFHFSSPDEKGRDQTTLALTRWLSGDTAGAKAAAEQARNTLAELPADALILVSLSQTYVALAEKEKAQNEAERAITLLPNAKDAVKGPSSKENLAFICSVFGEQARAISILTELLQTPYSSWLYAPTPITPALLRIDPLWDGLRGDPAFQKLCAEKQP